ncbi:PHB depolymerase family esterase [Amycolatopsis mongoliensis]|uniref:PHB depolymerase family esterase n=1 Tax=Amycolatopsis mongoliensis TaxID=715475 RepID=A0A9Y2K107_9PSEU|nr:PHB depolymerase family esterase [Amycolatopsis sp. 4-36]WIY07570.1 PHB depolymerase family esterase [Amycolatopsis sp. 4-36]
MADRYGFLVGYPSAQQEAGFGKCFDTWSDAAKHRGGGSDPVSIVSMVTYAEQHYGGDPSRVFATGSSVSPAPPATRRGPASAPAAP